MSSLATQATEARDRESPIASQPVLASAPPQPAGATAPAFAALAFAEETASISCHELAEHLSPEELQPQPLSHGCDTAQEQLLASGAPKSSPEMFISEAFSMLILGFHPLGKGSFSTRQVSSSTDACWHQGMQRRKCFCPVLESSTHFLQGFLPSSPSLPVLQAVLLEPANAGDFRLHCHRPCRGGSRTPAGYVANAAHAPLPRDTPFSAAALDSSFSQPKASSWHFGFHTPQPTKASTYVPGG